MDLTKRQQEIFDFIRKYSAKYGYPPTVRDIGKAVGLASSSTVHAHLANLEKIGLLRRDPSKPRAIELLDRAVESVRGIVRGEGLPLVGSVAAGAADARRGERRGVRLGARDRGRRRRRVSAADSRRLDEGRGHPGGRLRGRALPGHRAGRRRRGGAAGRGGDGQALLPREPTTSGCSPRTRRWSRFAARRSRCSGAWWACSGASEPRSAAGSATAASRADPHPCLHSRRFTR